MPWACRAVHSGTGLDLAHSLAPSLQLVLGSCWPFGSWTVGVVPGRLPCSLTLRVNSKMLLLGRQHWPVWFSSAHKSKSLSSVYRAFLVCEVAAVPVFQLYLCPRGLTSSRHLAPGGTDELYWVGGPGVSGVRSLQLVYCAAVHLSQKGKAAPSTHGSSPANCGFTSISASEGEADPKSC